jgi:hypothetical protein
MERALVLLHLGCRAVSSFSVTSMAGMPRQDSSIAAASPTGPPPTIKAKVSDCMALPESRACFDQLDNRHGRGRAGPSSIIRAVPKAQN